MEGLGIEHRYVYVQGLCVLSAVYVPYRSKVVPSMWYKKSNIKKRDLKVKMHLCYYYGIYIKSICFQDVTFFIILSLSQANEKTSFDIQVRSNTTSNPCLSPWPHVVGNRLWEGGVETGVFTTVPAHKLSE